MKKIIFVALAMMTAVCGCKAGEQSGSQTEKSAGKMVKETRQVGEFNGITLIGSCKVICTLGNTRSVVVEAPKEATQQLVTEVMPDGVLKISHKKIAGVTVVGSNEARTTVHVTVPALKSVKLVGSGDIIIKETLTSNDILNVSLNGSGDIDISGVDAKYPLFILSGSGNLAVGSIKSEKVDVSLAGSGDLKVGSIDSDDARITLSGSGDIAVGGVKAVKVKATAVGSGDMTIGKVDCDALDINHTSSGGKMAVGVTAVTTNVSSVGSGNLKLSGQTQTYNEKKFGSGKIDKSNLKYDQTTQTNQNDQKSVSSGSTVTSPNGIEAEP